MPLNLLPFCLYLTHFLFSYHVEPKKSDDPYERFILLHLQHYGFLSGRLFKVSFWMGLTTLDSFNGVSMSSDIALHIFLTFCFCIYIDNTSSVHAGVPIKREWEGNQDSTASDMINSPSESNDSNFEEEQEEPKPCQSKYVKLLDLGLLT